jgi:hypothetical protein
MKYLKKEQLMFKKTLLASAMMTLAAGAYAVPTFEGELDGGDPTDVLVTYSQQGMELVEAISTGQIFINFGVEYRVGDEIGISFDSPFDADIDLDELVGSTTHDLFDFEGIKTGEITLGLLEIGLDGKSFVLRVTEIKATGPSTEPTVTKNARIHLTQNGNFPLSGNSVRAAGGAVMTYSANAATIAGNGPALDGTLGGVDVDVIAFEDQFYAEVEFGFSQTIDVELQDGQFADEAIEVDYFTGQSDQWTTPKLSNQTDINLDSYYAWADAAYSGDANLYGAGDTVIAFQEVGIFSGEDLLEVAALDEDQVFLQGMTARGSRSQFTDGGEDVLRINVTDLEIDADDDEDNDGTDAVIEYAAVVINGDFSGLSVGVDMEIDCFADAPCMIGDIEKTDSQLSFNLYSESFSQGFGGVDAEVMVSPLLGVSYMDATTFTADVTIVYSPVDLGEGDDFHEEVMVEMEDAGEWVTNGTTVALYAVPWKAGTLQQNIWITNSGDSEAEVSAVVSYTDSEGDFYPDVELGVVGTAAPGVTNIGIELGPMLEALTPEGGSGRGTVTLITGADRSQINVDASYTHLTDRDRMRIVTSQTLNERSERRDRVVVGED